MPSSTVTAKGQTTIPKEIRDKLRLRPGSRVDYVLDQDGTVRLKSVSGSMDRLFSCLPKPTRALTLDEIEASVRKRGSTRL